MYQQIKEFFKQNSIQHEENDTQFLIDCPKCGKEGHVYMGQENGIWDCKVCGEKGNFYGYKKMVQDTAPKTGEALSEETIQTLRTNLMGNKSLLLYLQKRGISGSVIESERLGANDRGDLAIPFYEGEKLVAIKFRNMRYEEQVVKYEEAKLQGEEAKKPNKWYSIGKPGLYGHVTSPELLLCEGEFDRLSALSYGIKDVVSAPGCTTTEWSERLKDCKTVYICYDNDTPGQKGAYAIASRLGLNRCKNVLLPLKDLNDCLVQGVAFKELKQIILSAEKFPVPEFSTVGRWKNEVFYEAEHMGELRGYPTYHNKLDQMTRGFKGGQVRIVSGFTGVGKTTWTMNEMLLYAKQMIPVGIFCFESDQVDVIMNMVQYMADKPFAQMTKEEVYRQMDELDKLPIHFFDERNFTDSFTVVKFKELVKQIRDRFGIKFLVLDNMQFLLNFNHERKNFDEKVTELMTEVKNMAKILDIHVIGMVHLNRAAYGAKDKEGNRVIPKPQVHDLKGSSGYEQTADYVMFVHRDTGFDAPEEVRNDVEVIIAKNRPGKGITGVVNFKYVPDKCAYQEV